MKTLTARPGDRHRRDRGVAPRVSGRTGAGIRRLASPLLAVLPRAVGGGAVLVLIVAIDRVLLTRPPLPLPIAGVLDELAHLGTAALILAALPRPPRLGVASALVATVAIDSDHLPALLGWHGLDLAGERPLTHALWVPLLLLAASFVLPVRLRAILRWGALGVAIHFLRDAATGGIAALWPLTTAPHMVPHRGYLVVLAACWFVAVAQRAGRAPTGREK